jgi:hypothetical protein
MYVMSATFDIWRNVIYMNLTDVSEESIVSIFRVEE